MAAKRNDNDLMKDLFTATLSALVDRVKSGEATAADLNVARQMLKDNGIGSAPSVSPDMIRLSEVLPFTTDEEAA
jgi:hypothetical protein